jgi:hypothetical protein
MVPYSLGEGIMTLFIACLLIYNFALSPWLYAAATLLWLAQAALCVWVFDVFDTRTNVLPSLIHSACRFQSR